MDVAKATNGEIIFKSGKVHTPWWTAEVKQGICEVVIHIESNIGPWPIVRVGLRQSCPLSPFYVSSSWITIHKRAMFPVSILKIGSFGPIICQ